MQLITKFNRMIKSRLLWSIFAIFISVSFVATFTSQGGCDPTAGSSRAMAEYKNRKITPNEFTRYRFFEAGFRSRADISPAELDERTWNRIASLQLAKDLGIECSNFEIATIKANTPEFQENGIYNEARYRSMIENRFGVPVETYEEFIREQLILTKLRGISSACAWTSPTEINTKLAKLTDVFKVQYVLISNDISKSSVEVSEDMAREFFTTNTNLFLIPEKAQVKYVEFPFSNYMAKVSISSNEVTEYYEDHIDDFTFATTNDTKEAIPLTEAWSNIVNGLSIKKAAELAGDDAVDFSVAMIPDRDGTVQDMNTVLAAKNLSLRTTPFFSIDESIDGVDAPASFQKTAFELVPNDPERRVSDPVMGSESVFVLVAGSNQSARIPEFAEIKDKALTIVSKEQTAKAFEKKSSDTLAELKSAAAAGTAFTKAANNAGLKPVSAGPFSVFTEMTNDTAYSEYIASSAIRMDSGEVSELIPVDELQYLVVYVESREQGEPLAAEGYREELLSALNTYRGNSVFRSWVNTARLNIKRLDIAKVSSTDNEDSEEDIESEDL